MSAALVVITAASAAIVCAGLIVLIFPWLRRYVVAEPNARSSHKAPTPQGGGIAVILATILSAYGAALLFLPPSASPPLLLLIAIVLMGGIGVIADIRPIGVVPRLLLQMLAVALVIATLPADLRIVPLMPWWIERALLLIGGIWFVNLVNFMDGLDWMTAAEALPITAAVAAIGLLGIVPLQAAVVSLALCGAIIGFAYFNRPVAKLFLGDVGSLPIGLILGWLLVVLAGNGGRAAALVLPLYYLADSSLTLLRRLRNGERVWQAHRSHFYQRATDGGFAVIDVVVRVFATNIGLCALAIATVMLPGRLSAIAALIGAVILVVWLLITFSRGKR